jgi:uncharacterized iron-regulated membrane protein
VTFLLLDVRVDPVSPVAWTALIVLLITVLVLAASLVAGLVAFLIWWKRKKIRAEQAVEHPTPISPLT